MIARDPLTSALELVRMRTAIFCYGQLRAPWAFNVPTERGATFHIPLDNPVWVVRADAPPLHAAIGDFIVFPGGTPHVIADAPATPAVALQTVMAFEKPTLGMRTFSWSGDGATTTLLTGVFRFDPKDQRLLAALPDVLHVSTQDAAHHWLPSVLAFLKNEADTDGPGKQMILSRLGDIMFVQAVRAALASAAVAPGWFAALHDEQISTALGLIHRYPEREWTVAALARVSAMSRAAFARRFRSVAGSPPIEYLTEFRMGNAARRLREGALTIHEIAAQNGYQSEPALTKAFKRRYGVSPAGYRRAITAASGTR